VAVDDPSPPDLALLPLVPIEAEITLLSGEAISQTAPDFLDPLFDPAFDSDLDGFDPDAGDTYGGGADFLAPVEAAADIFSTENLSAEGLVAGGPRVFDPFFQDPDAAPMDASGVSDSDGALRFTFTNPAEAEFFAEGELRGVGFFAEPAPFVASFDAPLFEPLPSSPPPVLSGVTRIGGNGEDHLTGTPQNDFLDGGGGADFLEGFAGADFLNGGSGDDILDGGAGADHLAGGLGDDLYRLDDPEDVVFEAVSGSVGGFDSVEVGNPLIAAIGAGSAPATFVFAGGPLDGRVATDSAHLFFINDGIEALHLLDSAPANAIGNGEANTLTGNAAANFLWGEAGDDFLFGMGGDDILAGGSGDDFLDGGSGDDAYHFYGDETGFDVIADGSGVNFARLLDFSGTTEAVGGLDGNGDLTIFAHDPAASFVLFQPLFRVEGYGANSGAFAGVELDGVFFATGDLIV